MEKMTNSKALAFVIANCEIPADVKEKLVNIKASIDKKNGAERKPTATQTENVGYKKAIVDYLGTCDSAQTIGDIIKGCAEVADLTNQRVSAIVRQLKDDGIVVREEIKRKAYFSLAEVEEVEDEEVAEIDE